jgi:hypothetical protein
VSRWPDGPLVRNRLYGTAPGLVHAPGRLDESPWWSHLARRVSAASHRYHDCAGLEIVTWNSGSPNAVLAVRGHGLGLLEQSLDRLGVGYAVLGAGTGSRWTNRMKLELTLEHLGRSTAEFVLGADSSDALLVAEPASVLRAFLDHSAPVLFNAEKNPWPRELKDIARFERQVAPRPFRHLNSGLWIGKRAALIEAFRAATRWAARLGTHPASDQVCWKHAYRELYPTLQVDARCACFQTLNLVRREIQVDGRSWPRLPWLAFSSSRDISSAH